LGLGQGAEGELRGVDLGGLVVVLIVFLFIVLLFGAGSRI
jgi:hypothetical protein